MSTELSFTEKNCVGIQVSQKRDPENFLTVTIFAGYLQTHLNFQGRIRMLLMDTTYSVLQPVIYFLHS